eukprot:675987-Rhodomonas_salina.6
MCIRDRSKENAGNEGGARHDHKHKKGEDPRLEVNEDDDDFTHDLKELIKKLHPEKIKDEVPAVALKRCARFFRKKEAVPDEEQKQKEKPTENTNHLLDHTKPRMSRNGPGQGEKIYKGAHRFANHDDILDLAKLLLEGELMGLPAVGWMEDNEFEFDFTEIQPERSQTRDLQAKWAMLGGATELEHFSDRDFQASDT